MRVRKFKSFVFISIVSCFISTRVLGENLKHVATIDIPVPWSQSDDLEVIGDTLLVGVHNEGTPPMPGALLAYDISDPSSPQTCPSPLSLVQGPVHDLAIEADKAYLANEWLTKVELSGTCGMSISCETDPWVSFNQGNMGVDIYGDYIVVADHWAGLQLFDLSGSNCPSDPNGVLNLAGFEHDVAVFGTEAFVLSGQTLYSVDITDPTIPSSISSLPLSCDLDRIVLSDDGQTAFIVSRNCGLLIVDISDSANMQLIYTYSLDGTWDVAEECNLICICDENMHLEVLDVTDPSNPVMVYDYMMPYNVYRLAMSSGYIYASCAWDGKIVILSTPWTTKPLVSTSANETKPLWSPDGRQLGFISDESGNWQLYIINYDGTGKWKVTNNANQIREFVWSYDSRWILYSEDTSDADLVIVKLNESRTAVEDECNVTDDSYGWGRGRFSPDKMMITAGRGSGGISTLWEMPAECNGGSSAVQIGEGAFSNHPTYDPSGNCTAFMHSSDYDTISDIWQRCGGINTKIIDGSVINQHIFSLAYSCNGQFIAYADEYSDLQNDVVGIVDVNSGNIIWQEDIQSGICHQAYSWVADVWSPDNNYLLYSRKECGYWNIWIVDINGNKLPLVVSDADDMFARYSKYGMVAFQTNRNGNWDIYITRPSLTFHVDTDNGDNSNVGLTEETAFKTIQKGIETAWDGDTVLVWPGEYQEDVNYLGKAITVKSAADAAAIVADSTYAVSFVTVEQQDSVLENFVIRDSLTGIQTVGTNPTIRFVTVVDNDRGIWADLGADPNISNSILWNNTNEDLVNVSSVTYSWVHSELGNNIEGLVGYWRFDEGSGTEAKDSSGNGYNGTINGATWTTGKVGGALSFDGTDDFVEIGSSSDIAYDEMTICSWARKSSLDQDTRMIVAKHQSTVHTGYYLATTHNKFTWDVFPNLDGIESDDEWDLEWHYLVGTYDNGESKLYVDGELIDTLAEGSMTNNGLNVLIGACVDIPGTGYKHYWAGIIDEVSIYDRVLSEIEIRELYENGTESYGVGYPQFASPARNDYHLRSVRGRYRVVDPNDFEGAQSIWILDDVSSPCIDAGDPTIDPANEELPHKPGGGRVNMGAYGNTAWASKSEWPSSADLNRDGIVNLIDLAEMAQQWLEVREWVE